MWKLSKVFKLLCEFYLWGFRIDSNLRMHSHCTGDEVDIDTTEIGEFRRTRQDLQAGDSHFHEKQLGSIS